MAAYRRIFALGLVLLAAPLGGCLGIDATAGLGAGAEPEMTARAPETGNLPEPNDYIAAGKQSFRDRSFGLAEKHFSRAVEVTPSNAEAWLGLAATHDQLGRFDLADKEYAQVAKKTGTTFELLNNRGYSYMLRGDFTRARRDFEAARRLEPDSEFVRNNLRALDAKSAARS